MKSKKIMLMAFLLLAVLTIGAVSASDDVASDDLAVSDDGDEVSVSENDDLAASEEDDSVSVSEDDKLAEMTKDDVEIDVTDIDPETPEKNFTEVTVSEKTGEFVIYREGEKAFYFFSEGLGETDGGYVYDDGEYIFGFTYNDLNEYIKDKVDDADNFMDLVEDERIVEGDSIRFAVLDDDGIEISGLTKIISFREDGMILFDDPEEESGVEVDYVNLDVVMSGDWKSDVFLDFKVRKDITGKIVINLNEDEVFNKNLSNLDPVEDEEDINFVHYIITFNNLTADLDVGEYGVAFWVYDEEGEIIEQYDDEEPEVLRLYEPQEQKGENATVKINPVPTFVDDEDELITIETEEETPGFVIVSVDNEDGIIIPLERVNNDGAYVIGSKELNYPKFGTHTLNVTYEDINLEGNITLKSNVYISLTEGDEVVYTGYGLSSNIVQIGLFEGDTETELEGKINATVYDENYNVISTIETNITDLYYHDGPRAYVIRTEDFDFEEDLDGTYLIAVRYFDGNKASTENESEVVFKLFDPEEFETEINTLIRSTDDYLVTFADIPQYMGIDVFVDEDEPVYFDYWQIVKEWYDDDKGVYYIPFSELDDIENGEHFISVGVSSENEYIEFANATVYVQIEGDDDIEIDVDTESEFDLNNDEDKEKIFASVTVSGDYDGNITITADDGEGDEIVFFNKNLNEMVMAEGNSYQITLSELDELDTFKEIGRFKIAFIAFDEEEEEYEEIASKKYDISCDDDVLTFTECDIDPEGYEIDIDFEEKANVVTDDTIVTIYKDELPDGVDNNFTVVVNWDGGEIISEILLSDLEADGEAYYVGVSDIFTQDDVGESIGCEFMLQFFVDGEKVCYGITQEEEYVCIYTSPYINDEVNVYKNDLIISFTDVEDADDEFTVTISQEGSEDVVKKFKISELENLDEEDESPFYELLVSDLNLTKEGYYTVSVNLTKKGEQYLSNSRDVHVSSELEIIGPEEGASFEYVSDCVFALGVTKDINGYVTVFVDGAQVGENITFDSLKFREWGPHKGRQVILNQLHITEGGDHNVEVKVYDENGEFLNEMDTNINVTVGENTVTFKNGSYPTNDVIFFDIKSPIADNGYFIIYLNGKKAGIYNISHPDIDFDDEFLDVYAEHGKFLKVGEYDVNVTYFNGAGEEDMATGHFSIKSLNVTSDKKVYSDMDEISISFKADDWADKYPVFRIEVIKGWGVMGPDDSIFEDKVSGDDLKDIWDEGVITYVFDADNLVQGKNFIYVYYYLFDSEDDAGYDDDDDVDKYLVGSDLIAVTLEVDPLLDIVVDNFEEGSVGEAVITAVESFNGDVLVQVAGGNYTVTLTDGYGSLPLADLAKGTYTAVAIIEDAEGFEDSEASVDFNVTAKEIVLVDPSLTISVPNTAKSNSVVVTVTTNTAFSGTVNVQIASKNYAVNVVNGKGTISVSGLAVGTYTATATFTATGVFKQSTKSVSFKVKEDTIKLAVKKVTIKKSAKKLVIKATLKINGKKVKGKKITLKFKGKKYKVKTNKKGVAKFTIKKKVLKKLKVGKKITYKVTYGKKSAKKTVKVKK